MSAALIAFLGEHGRRLSQQVLDEQYRDPFWTERFGARGRHHADEDSDFHMRYLVAALESGDSRVLERYARWLREVLVSRGMCTEHLAENFRLLAGAIVAAGAPDATHAALLLAATGRSLLYDDGPAREMQDKAPAIAARIDRAFPARRADTANYLSYVADALAAGFGTTLASHTRWLKGPDLAPWLDAIRAELAAAGLSAAAHLVEHATASAAAE